MPNRIRSGRNMAVYPPLGWRARGWCALGVACADDVGAAPRGGIRSRRRQVTPTIARQRPEAKPTIRRAVSYQRGMDVRLYSSEARTLRRIAAALSAWSA